jgi:hypothetical protein
MSENSYSLLLRNLSNDYYYNHMSFEDYRVQRRIILDKIDEDFNGTETMQTEQEVNEKTSIFMQTISFFKNTDVTK